MHRFKSHSIKPLDPALTGKRQQPADGVAAQAQEIAPAEPPKQEPPREIGGPTGPEPTRYGDWERKGICVDF